MDTVLHVTSVHKRSDTRIFLKECVTLSGFGYNVHMLVSDGLGEEYESGVCIYDVGKSNGRVDRVTRVMFKIMVAIFRINPRIIHFHDPELLFLALFFKFFKYKIVFDFHEDVPLQIMNKRYLFRGVRSKISYAYSIIEKFIANKFDAIIAATPAIQEKFLCYNKNTININNYPKIDEFLNLQFDSNRSFVCYVGALSSERGILQIIKAMELVRPEVTLIIGGAFADYNFEREVTSLPGWSRVKYLGFLNRNEIRCVFESSFAGLVTLLPVSNYIDSLPVKMFEYMLSGLPVIASNFRLWSDILDNNRCGICIDPLSPGKIAETIEFLFDNPCLAQKMGLAGRSLVINKYNWENESKKLINLYKDL